MAENHALIPEAATMFTQTESLKEAKDLSKNLVSGDFERQYRDEKLEQSGRRRQAWLVTLAVAVSMLTAWLLVVTMVREIQISQLRHEVDQLTANMIAITANVKSLNQKISSNRLFNEFKTFEDTFYADDDQEGPAADKDKNKQDYGSLEKLQGLTIIEDENMADDEDMYDGDEDAESGDWYPDYDRRREKIGTTNMVRLKPEDFVNNKALTTKFGEIKRLLKENPETSDIDFASIVPKSKEVPESTEEARSKRSVFPDTAADAVDQYAAPRTLAKTDERRKIKKYLSSTETAGKLPLQTVTRTARSNTDEASGRPFVAAHFHGNTSHLSTEIHEHYKGNGIVRVSHGAAHDVWYPSSWTSASPHPRPTLTRNGHVHVHHTGVYLVYVQIYYLDSHDIVSWVLHRTNADIDGRETLLQCAQSSHSLEPFDKPNSCFSASALFLRAGDRLAVRNTGGDRHSIMQTEKSFIGLIKLADAEDPNQEL